MAHQMTSPINPEAQRETPLALELKNRIRSGGPITVEEYVHTCLYDPQHGYYVSKSAIGHASDFITAPEISQIFGELLGIWAILTWQQLGSPTAINLIELGPGRGTMMADALRSIAKMPELVKAIEIHLVDTNSVLRETQQKTLSSATVTVNHYKTTTELAQSLGATSTPSIVLANEFVDALGIRQQIAHDGHWCQRLVDLDSEGRLFFSVGQPIRATQQSSTADGAIQEYNPAIEQIIQPLLVALAREAPMAALFIDYGYTQTTIGETLQAVRSHGYEHVLTSPGEADLTAHVDFASLADCLSATGLTIDGPTPQAEFLGRLGIVERSSQLMAQNPTQASTIETGIMRLMAPNGMGTRFQAIGARNWVGPSLSGFATVT